MAAIPFVNWSIGGLTLSAVDAAIQQQKYQRFRYLFPEHGPYRRELYAKHFAFFAAGGIHKPMVECPEGCDGSPHRERAFLAGNRTGKTVASAYEMALHLTGDYPDWWPGRRFPRPIRAWAAGTTNVKTKEIVQTELFGRLERDKAGNRMTDVIGLGTGTIPGNTILNVQMRSGVPNAIEQAWIQHKSGGRSTIAFKSYEMGRAAFEGTSQDCIAIDEECDLSVYTECLMRTMTTNGLVWLTFTPLQGLSPLILEFLPGGKLAA